MPGTGKHYSNRHISRTLLALITKRKSANNFFFLIKREALYKGKIKVFNAYIIT
jgi:hypothetical protein